MVPGYSEYMVPLGADRSLSFHSGFSFHQHWFQDAESCLMAPDSMSAESPSDTLGTRPLDLDAEENSPPAVRPVAWT